MRNKKLLWAIIPGFIISFVYSWEVFAGNATAKVWFLFISGLTMFVTGLLFFFGIIKDKANNSPKDVYARSLWLCVGWGLCALVGWFDKDCAFDHNTITNILVLAYLVAITIKQKYNLPKD